jgi:hypothetical protein
MNTRIVDLNLKNIKDFSSVCFCKKDNHGLNAKIDWIKKRLKEGLKIKIITDDSGNTIRGYIEYTNGKNAFRAVDAKGYLVIHCIWITPNKYKNKGYGSSLIKECIKDAKGKIGVAVVTSDDSFMAEKKVFIKNGFKLIEEEGKQQLLVLQNKKGALPKFKDYKEKLAKLKGWHIIYSNQCPWVARFIDELDKKIINKFNIKITELKTAKQAQNAPSIYSVFNLIKDGELLADHYISNTRFSNILKKFK